MLDTMNKRDVIFPPEGKHVKPSQIKSDLSDIEAVMVERLGHSRMLDKNKAIKLIAEAKKTEITDRANKYYVKVGKVGQNLVLRVKKDVKLGGHVGDVVLVKGYAKSAKDHAAYSKAAAALPGWIRTATIAKLWQTPAWKKEIVAFFKSKYMGEQVDVLLSYEKKPPRTTQEKKAYYERFIADGGPDQIAGGAGGMSGMIATFMKLGRAEDFDAMDWGEFYTAQLSAINTQEQVTQWKGSKEFRALVAKIEPEFKALAKGA